MERGTVRKVFPGGNTGVGFHSFYEHIIGEDAERLFIIKGGPGVGKSTFMRRLADEVLEMGLDLELECCSSDNDSLDGVLIPGLRVAFIDGTAPHVVDPKNPAAVDEIINFGDYWNRDGIRKHRDDILRINRETGRLFRRAYDYLAIAKHAMDLYERNITDLGALDFGGLSEQAESLADSALGQRSRRAPAKVRRMFASAISPGGLVNHLDTLMKGIERKYLVMGTPGTGRTTMIKKVADLALSRGFFVECFHCALDPSKVDHVIVPDLGVAIINCSWPHAVTAESGDVVIDTNRFVITERLGPLEYEIAEAERTYRQALENGQKLISQAKRKHDELEQYYSPYMDFDGIHRLRARMLDTLVKMMR